MNDQVRSVVSGQWPVVSSPATEHRRAPAQPLRTTDCGLQTTDYLAFTLIEMLVVIAVMAILASLIFPVTGAIKKARVRTRARVELNQVQSVIEDYHTKLGYYPPDNPGNPATNQLYYELLGTALTNSGNTFVTKDGSAQIASAQVPVVFANATLQGFMNSTKGGNGDDSAPAVNFFRVALRAGQFLAANGPHGSFLGTSLDGPLMFVDVNGTKLNPWRYNSTNPTNNPSSYDLWVDVLVGNDTNRISNWSTTPVKVYAPGQ